MAMGKCMECGGAVSGHAKACPSCGAPLTYGGRHPWLAAVAAGIVVFIAVAGLRAVEADRISRLPPLPVEVKFRPSLMGASSGMVVLVENASYQPLPLKATFRHSAIDAAKTYDLYVPARSHTDIGRLNGWIAEHGDRVMLQNAGYQPWSGSIP